MPSFVAALLAILLALPASAQSPQAVKDQVQRIAIGGKLTVETRDGRELHGNLSSIDADTFALHEVDQQTLLTVRYDEARKVSNNYGRKGFGGKRVNPKRSLIVGIVIVGALLGLVFGAVLSDHS